MMMLPVMMPQALKSDEQVQSFVAFLSRSEVTLPDLVLGAHLTRCLAERKQTEQIAQLKVRSTTACLTAPGALDMIIADISCIAALSVHSVDMQFSNLCVWVCGWGRGSA